MNNLDKIEFPTDVFYRKYILKDYYSKLVKKYISNNLMIRYHK